MREVKTIGKKDFKTPLGLIGFKRVQISYDGNGELRIEKQTIQVPGETAWVCISVTDIDMHLMPCSQYANGLRFNTVVDELLPPMLQYSVSAQMSSVDPTDHWKGTIWVTILCFGEIPKP